MHEQTYQLIRLIADRPPGQPLDLADVKAIGAVAMADWTRLRLALAKESRPDFIAPSLAAFYIGGD